MPLHSRAIGLIRRKIDKRLAETSSLSCLLLLLLLLLLLSFIIIKHFYRLYDTSAENRIFQSLIRECMIGKELNDVNMNVRNILFLVYENHCSTLLLLLLVLLLLLLLLLLL